MSSSDHDAASRTSHRDTSHSRYSMQRFSEPSHSQPQPADPPPTSIHPTNGPPSLLASGAIASFALRPHTSAPPTNSLRDTLQSVGEISPPPLRRSRGRVDSPSPTTGNPDPSLPLRYHASSMQMAQPATPPPRSSRPKALQRNWNQPDLTKALQDLLRAVRQDHSRLVAHSIESTTPTEWRVHHGANLFEGMGSEPVPQTQDETMRVKFKQHLKTRKDAREEHHNINSIRTIKDRVPRYRFHHVGIRKNVLTPNTMLTFVPHLRDLESSEESKYNVWLKELEEIDTKSGFKPMNREEKVILTIQTERAATVSLYLDNWLEKLGMASCTKSALVACMNSQESDDNVTPQRGIAVMRSNRGVIDGNPTAGDSSKAAALFTGAFSRAFDNKDMPLASRIQLRRVLLLEQSTDGLLDSKSVTKDAGDPDDVAEAYVGTYSLFGCLICFSNSCEHGEYDSKNFKRTFSMMMVMSLADVLRQRRGREARADTSVCENGLPHRQGCYPCGQACYLLSSSPHDQTWDAKPWEQEEEVMLLKSIFATVNRNKLELDPICFTAHILDRNCSDVYAKFESLALPPLKATRPEPPRLKTLPWYDNRRKVLSGDWQDHTVTHEHQHRDIIEPCAHEGACNSLNCPCVKAGILCEKWCRCTSHTCSYKFTGCSCHSIGKTCQAKQKEKPCICVQLNRECDPDLCGTCGVLERTDPLNADFEMLHETGCQNCELQRGSGKQVVLGQSQLDGVGYGLFTAENIAQDDFVIEYVGELITHDEGVRREARRGDVFDQGSNISYIFTLLDNEGIWVDAAIYGNLSRYINHASEHDQAGSNITPRILYVNGDYRIKFTALRDIRAGEELFFNYGENFPNLTKKLLKNRTSEKPAVPRKPGRPARSAAGKDVARKAPRPEQKKIGRKKPLVRGRSRRIVAKDNDYDDADDGGGGKRAPYASLLTRPVKRKRALAGMGSDDDGYRAPRSIAQNKWQDYTAEDEEGVEEEATPNGGATTRRSLRNRASETPTKAKVKVTGRRGGARPGSGRPRKHPLPVPKAVLKTTEGPRSLRESPKKSTWNEESSRISPLPAYQNRPERAQAEEIQDSEEWSTGGEDNGSRSYGLRAAGTAARESDGETRVKEEEKEETGRERDRQKLRRGATRERDHAEEEDDDDDDDDDQDVVVRRRVVRATRNRRPPAKFRGDDFFY